MLYHKMTDQFVSLSFVESIAAVAEISNPFFSKLNFNLFLEIELQLQSHHHYLKIPEKSVLCSPLKSHFSSGVTSLNLLKFVWAHQNNFPLTNLLLPVKGNSLCFICLSAPGHQQQQTQPHHIVRKVTVTPDQYMRIRLILQTAAKLEKLIQWFWFHNIQDTELINTEGTNSYFFLIISGSWALSQTENLL